MNKILFVLIFLSHICFGQEEVSSERIVGYDSLANFLADDAYKYKGQELFLRGKHSDIQKWGYYSFYEDIKLTKHYKEQKDGNSSEYSALACKCFKVLDVINHTMVSFPLSKFEYILKLQKEDDFDIVYFKYDPDRSEEFYFWVKGYLDKLKEIYLGKKYKLKEYLLNKSRDIVTKKKICYKANEWWKVIDITLDKENYMPMILVRNGRGNLVAVDLVFLKLAEEADD